MKLSVSLTKEDVALLDRYVAAAGLESRSAGLHHAIRRLTDPEMEQAYAAAWDEWEATGDAASWESTVGDGLTHASR